MLDRAKELTGVEWIVTYESGFYYLFNVDHNGPVSCHFLVQRFDQKGALKQYLRDLEIVEEELQN